MIELIYLLRMGLSVLLGLIIGLEREQNDKPAGLRTVLLIIFGATLITIFTLKMTTLHYDLDAIRAIAYYLVAIGFVGGGIISRKQGKLEGITTASLLLPVSVIGFLCGFGEYTLAIASTLIIYVILKLKHLRIKIRIFQKKRRKKCLK